MMKNAFYFTLKALFVLKIFKIFNLKLKIGADFLIHFLLNLNLLTL